MSPQQSLPRITRDGMSTNNKSEKGRGSLPNKNRPQPSTGKRGIKKSHSRANHKRLANTRLTQTSTLTSSGRVAAAGRALEISLKSKSNNKLSFEDTLNIMNRRKTPESEITNKELEEITNASEDQQTAAKGERKKIVYQTTVANTKVPIHGNLRVEDKDDEALRVLGVNINSMSFWLRDNYKADRLKFIFEKYGIDAAGLQEVCINWSEFKASQTLATILRSKTEKIRSVASHNKKETKNVGRNQRGGTATILRNQLAAFVVDSNTDHTGLGRWSWYLVEGEPGHRTYFITAYAPCGNTAAGHHTVYKQQERFIHLKGLNTNPKAMFREDLLEILRRWRKNGDRVVLIMDANEHVIDGAMCKQLAGEDLQMREAVHSETNSPGPKTWFRGADPIDGIWVSSEIDVIGASYLPFDGSLVTTDQS